MRDGRRTGGLPTAVRWESRFWCAWIQEPNAQVRSWTWWWMASCSRPLDGGPYPYLWLDALTQKVREDGRIVTSAWWLRRRSMAMASGRSSGWTWVSEDGAFWLAFLRSHVRQGLTGVERGIYADRDSAAPSPSFGVMDNGAAPTHDKLLTRLYEARALAGHDGVPSEQPWR